MALLAILLEAILPAFRGGPGVRVRVKPSWSGKVYGTYAVSGQLVVFALAVVVSTGALLGRLLALNLAHPGVTGELAALRRSNAHGWATRDVRLPAAARDMTALAERLDRHAHSLNVMLGLQEEGGGGTGLGRIDEAEVVVASGSHLPLEHLEAEVARLGQRYQVLEREVETRGEELRFLPSVAPISQAEFIPTSPFGRRRSPFTGEPEFHRGQDLAADMYTRIVATADGVVVHVDEAATASRMGRYVVIDHGGRYLTFYGHCERVLVRLGDRVVRKQLIAEVGNTGRSTGPHVHYEVRVAGEPRDPRHFMMFDPHFAVEEQFQID